MRRRTRNPVAGRSASPGVPIATVLDYASAGGNAWPVGRVPLLQDMVAQLGILAPLIATYGTNEEPFTSLSSALQPYAIVAGRIRHSAGHPGKVAVVLQSLALMLHQMAGEDDSKFVEWWAGIGGALRNALTNFQPGECDGLYRAARNLVDQASMSQMPGWQFPGGHAWQGGQLPGAPTPDGGLLRHRPLGNQTQPAGGQTTLTQDVADLAPIVGAVLGTLAGSGVSSAVLGVVGEQLGERIKARYGSRKVSQNEALDVARDLVREVQAGQGTGPIAPSPQQEMFSPVPPNQQQSSPVPGGGAPLIPASAVAQDATGNYINAGGQVVTGLAGVVGGAYGGQAGAQAGQSLGQGLTTIAQGIAGAIRNA